MPHDHDDEGFAHDLPRLMGRRGVLLSLLGMGMGGYAIAQGFSPPPGGSEAELTATGADGAVCVKDPGETNGPYPADGTNTREGQVINALEQEGVIRDDLRQSFAGLSGAADGIPMVLEIALVDVGNACLPLAGHAIYLWHCDSDGKYSLYDFPEQNFLRGVVLTDGAGKATVTTILPGCYDGRWPHIHFEVFASAEAATSGHAALLTSQMALPEATCRLAYADDRYPSSLRNLDRTSLSGDNVFGDNTAAQIAQQTLTMNGDPSSGYRATVTVGIA